MNESGIKQEIPMSFNLDDFYTTQEQRDDDKKEKISEIDITLIDNFKNHPFRVIENDELESLQDSIKNNGLLEAVILRPKDDGRFEMISGHRRLLACKKLGLDAIPSRIRNLTDDEATIYMVDSNLHRDKILPSEKAFAFKMRLEAMKHQGERKDLTCATKGHKLENLKSRDKLANEVGESHEQIRRYIRLTYLEPKLLEYVDNEVLGLKPKMGVRSGATISYLTKEEQECLIDCIKCYQATPSVAQAMELKRLSEDKQLNEDLIHEIMSEEKGNQIPMLKFDENRLRRVLPKNIEQAKIEDFIVKSVEYYSRYLKQKDRER